MAPPAGSDSGLRPPQGQSHHRKPIWLSSYITYSKGAKTLAPIEYNMERTECVPKDDFDCLKFGCLQLKVRDEKNLPVLKTTSALLKFWCILKLADMERTECVPKGDFGFLKFGCLQLKVRDEKNLPVLKTTSGSALAQ